MTLFHRSSMTPTARNHKRRYVAAAALAIPIFTMGLVRASFSEAATTVPLNVTCNEKVTVAVHEGTDVTGASLGDINCTPTDAGHLDIPSGTQVAAVLSGNGVAEEGAVGGTVPANATSCAMTVTTTDGVIRASFSCS